MEVSDQLHARLLYSRGRRSWYHLLDIGDWQGLRVDFHALEKKICLPLLGTRP
jgi:hypothetical protein